MKTNLLKSGKSLLSIILAVCLIVSVCSTGISFAVSAEESTGSVLSWDGKTISATDDLELLNPDAANSEDNPYIIDSAADMVGLSRAGSTSTAVADQTADGNWTYGKYFKVADGIEAIYFNDVADVAAEDIATYFASITPNNYTTDAKNYVFAGHFDGNGATFYGVYSEDMYAAGLFEYAAVGASIKNVTIAKSYISSKNNPSSAGGIIARTINNDSSEIVIENCAVVDNYIYSAGNYVAGIAAYTYANAVTISNCLVAGNTITAGGSYKGGFICEGWTGTRTITNSVCLGTAPDSNKSNCYASQSAMVFTNVYSDTACNSESTSGDTIYTLAAGTVVTGSAARTAMPNLLWGLAWQLGGEGEYPMPYDSGIKYSAWDGTSSDTTWDAWDATSAEAAGSQANPYVISSAAELYGMVKSNGSSGSYFKVSDDIDLFVLNNIYGMTKAEATAYFEDTTITKNSWYSGSNSAFSGSFDGNGATILGLYSSSSNDYGTGFISYAVASAVTVENVAFDKCYSTNSSTGTTWASASIVIGRASSTSTVNVKNVQVTDSTAKSLLHAAVICGVAGTSSTATTNIENVVTSGNTLSGTKYVGTLLAEGWSAASFTITNCISTESDINTVAKSSYATTQTATNLYSAYSSPTKGTYLAQDSMKGYAAYTNMSALDWVDTFTADDGEIPELKLFKYGSECLYSGGSGTEADPYLISNAIDLQYMVQFNGYVPVYDSATDTYTIGTTQAYHKLTNDIYINPVNGMATADAFTYLTASGITWDNTDYTGTDGIFVGNIDGDYHTIYGFYNTSNKPSMFYKIGASSLEVAIKNLAVRKSYIKSASRGLLFAYQTTGTTTFSNCAVADTYLEGTSVTLVFQASSGTTTFENCATITDSDTGAIFNSTASGTWNGGFLGDGWATGMVFNNCVSIGILPMDNLMTSANFCGSKVTYSNVYTDVDYTQAANYETRKDSVDAKFVSGAMEYLPADSSEADEKMWIDVDYDTYLSEEAWGGEDGLISPEDFVKQNYTYWDGTATDLANMEGEGTAEKPFLIYTAEDVYRMVLNKGQDASGNAAYWQVADKVMKSVENGGNGGVLYFNPIKGMSAADAQTYLASPANSWNPATSDFNGTFDGNGVTLIGLAYTTTSTNVAAGFIPQVKTGTATIENVTFDRCYFSVESNNNTWHKSAGIVVGAGVSGTATINIDKVIVKDSYSENRYLNSSSVLAGSAAAVVGGLSGNNTLNVTNVLTYGNTVTGGASATGSILGDMYSSNPITVNISNTLSADDEYFVSNSSKHASGTLVAGYGNNTYTNVYAVSVPTSGTYTGVETVAAENTTGAGVVSAMPNLPWYEGWMPSTDGEYPYFGSLGYKIWSGNADTDWETWDGTDVNAGTASNPYKITSADELYGMITEHGKSGSYFKVADELAEKGIYINPIKGMDKATATAYFEAGSARPWSTDQTSFNGHFDGNGATIYGLYSSASTGYNAFINIVAHGNAATVENVTFNNCYFKNTASSSSPWSYGASVIIGKAGSTSAASGVDSANIAISHVKLEDCTATSSNGSALLIGFAGYIVQNIDFVITVNNTVYSNNASGNAAKAASVVNGGAAWGIVTSSSSLSNCIFTEAVDDENDYAYQAEYLPASQPATSYFGTISSVYTAGKNDSGSNATILTQDQMKGSAAVGNMTLSWYNGWMPGAEGEYPYFGSADIDIWSGKTDTDWATWDGTDVNAGTASNPYKITSAEELHGMVTELGMADGTAAYFKVSDELAEKGIYLNYVDGSFDAADGTAPAYYSNNWMNGQTTGSNFVGNFDGNGATIYGLYASSTSASAGFISRAGTATIKNISFKDAYVYSSVVGETHGAGVLIGRGGTTTTDAEAITLSKCRVENCYVYGSYSAAALIGNSISSGVAVSTCFIAENNINSDTASGSNGPYVGAVTGDTWSGTRTISDTVALGIHVMSNKASTVFACTNCYTDTAWVKYDVTDGTTTDVSGVTVVTGEVKGTAAETNMPKLSWSVNWTAVENDYPAFMELDYAFWDGTADTDWEGKGTKESPFLIYTAEELYGMVTSSGRDSEGNSAYFKVADGVTELYLNPIKGKSLEEAQSYMTIRGTNWSQGITNRTNHVTAFTPFTGKFDGNGVVIRGMYSTTSIGSGYATGVGFIRNMGNGAVVKNVQFDMPYVNAADGIEAAVLCSYFSEDVPTVAIANVAVTNGYVVNSDREDSEYEAKYGAAGLVVAHGGAYLTITNCLYQGEVINNSTYGGVNTGNAYAIMGYTKWTSGNNSYVSGCIAVVNDGISLVSDCDSYDINVSNSYTTATDDATVGVTSVTTANLNKTGMPALDWSQWQDAAFTTAGNIVIPMPIKTDVWEFVNWNTSGAGLNGIISDYSIFDGGNGTAAKPYGIATGEQLYKAILTGGQRYGTKLYFKLTADIDLANGAWITSANEYYTAFIGSLDGDGHTVYNLYSANEGGYAGLIPQVADGAVIKNIHIIGANVYGANAGAITGGAADGATVTISGCSVSNGAVSGTVAGGIIGAATSTTTIADVFYVGTASDGFIGNGLGAVANAYTTAASTLASTDNKVYAEVAVGDITANDLGTDNWYQGNKSNHLPKLKNQAAAREYLDMEGDGEIVAYEANDLTSLRSKLLYRSAYNYVYGDITYDGSLDIRDLMILKRSMGNDYADADEGFWPNLRDYTIVYQVDATTDDFDDYRDAALELQRYFLNLTGIEVPVKSTTQAEEPYQVILLGDWSEKGLSTSLGDNAFDMNYYGDGYYSIWMQAKYVAGIEELVDLFKANAEYGAALPTASGTFGSTLTVNGTEQSTAYKAYKCIKGVTGQKSTTSAATDTYVYVWGDEFDDTYSNTSNTSANYFNFNNWRVSHSLSYWDDIDIALPKDMGKFNYISNGKLVMHNDVSGKYWSNVEAGTSNGFEKYNADDTTKDDWVYATGGVLDTRNSMLFKRGYAELVATVPNSKNVFPAWWLYASSFTTNASVENSLFSKVFELNADYDGSTDAFDPTNSATYKYKVPYVSVEIDIFEVMNTTDTLLWWDTSDYNYSMNIHKRYKNTYVDSDSTAYDTFGYYGTAGTALGTRGESSPSTNINSNSLFSYNSGFSGEYVFSAHSQVSTSQQKYEERTYYFLWDEDEITMWDSANNSKQTVSIANDAAFDAFVYMLFDNHLYSPASSNSSGNTLPTDDLVIDSVRLYQVAGERELITPDSESRY